LSANIGGFLWGNLLLDESDIKLNQGLLTYLKEMLSNYILRKHVYCAHTHKHSHKADSGGFTLSTQHLSLEPLLKSQKIMSLFCAFIILSTTFPIFTEAIKHANNYFNHLTL